MGHQELLLSSRLACLHCSVQCVFFFPWCTVVIE